MDITTRFDSVDQWLEDCVSNEHGSHETCRDIKVPGYPSRLLDIDGFETSGQVRLVDTKDWLKPLPEYTTLSHCWGSVTGPHPLNTMEANIQSHKTGIPMENLPKTFQDAVKITHRIGKRFLWIDSLAIIQHNTQDWEFEAAQMAAIYENSFLTIAATTSENCQGGCDLEPWDLCIIEGRGRTSPVPGLYQKLPPETEYQMKLKRTTASWVNAGTPLPLHTRGWALQEAILSRRVLHMTSHHMLWQCREIFDYEDANVRHSAKSLPLQLSNVGFLWDRRELVEGYNRPWWNLAENYSQRNFTYSIDKLPAIAGMVGFYAAMTHDIPLLGLWKSSVAADLSWRCDKEQDSTLPGIPTWTWFSTRGRILKPFDKDPDSNSQLLVDAWAIDWEHQAYVSELQKGTLRVKSKIFETTLKGNTNSKDQISQNLRPVLMWPIDDDQTKGYRRIDYRSDIAMTSDTPKGFELTYLLLYTHKAKTWKAESVVFLALRATPDDPSAYVRIGCGRAIIDLGPITEPWALPESGWPGFGFIDHFLKDWKDATITLC
ncbi:MAG: hypothetical protein JWP58_4672 [Hymenobacter sp.]|jgi:hypothetical protein|nr:hypothetical protein [Hymenobacter sp.]